MDTSPSRSIDWHPCCWCSFQSPTITVLHSIGQFDLIRKDASLPLLGLLSPFLFVSFFRPISLLPLLYECACLPPSLPLNSRGFPCWHPSYHVALTNLFSPPAALILWDCFAHLFSLGSFSLFPGLLSPPPPPFWYSSPNGEIPLYRALVKNRELHPLTHRWTDRWE